MNTNNSNNSGFRTTPPRNTNPNMTQPPQNSNPSRFRSVPRQEPRQYEAPRQEPRRNDWEEVLILVEVSDQVVALAEAQKFWRRFQIRRF